MKTTRYVANSLEDLEDGDCAGFVEFEDGTRVYGSEKVLLLISPDGKVLDDAYKSGLTLEPYASSLREFEEAGGYSDAEQATPAEIAEWEHAMRFVAGQNIKTDKPTWA